MALREKQITLYGQYLIIETSAGFELYFIRTIKSPANIDFVGLYPSFTDATEATIEEYR